MLSGETGMHVASFQDGTEPLSDLEYSRGTDCALLHFVTLLHVHTNV